MMNLFSEVVRTRKYDFCSPWYNRHSWLDFLKEIINFGFWFLQCCVFSQLWRIYRGVKKERGRKKKNLFWFLLFPLLHLDLHQAVQLINISIFLCITLDYDCLFWFLISPELRQSAQLINISIFRWIALDSDFNGTENNSITDERYRLSHVSIIEQLIARAHTHASTHARSHARAHTHITSAEDISYVTKSKRKEEEKKHCKHERRNKREGEKREEEKQSRWMGRNWIQVTACVCYFFFFFVVVVVVVVVVFVCFCLVCRIFWLLYFRFVFSSSS